MLIYPLDLEYDQRSNALKVEFHKIGLRGIGENEDAEDMREKIVRLLENTDINFKENIEKLCSVINKKYTDNYVDSILNQIFNLDL